MQRIRKILHLDFSQNFIFGPISFQFDPKTTDQNWIVYGFKHEYVIKNYTINLSKAREQYLQIVI